MRARHRPGGSEPGAKAANLRRTRSPAAQQARPRTPSPGAAKPRASGFDRAAADAADAPSGFDRAAADAADAPSLPETRRKGVARRALLELLVLGVEANRALEEHQLVFAVVRVRQAALHRTDGLTCLVIVEADTFRAELRVDDVDLVALTDGLVRALGLAGAAIDAVG